MIYDLQKASLLKRFSAFLLDFIVICILATGFTWLVTLIADFDGTYAKYDVVIDRYDQQYGVELRKGIPNDASEETKTKYENAYKAFSQDEEGTKLYTKIFDTILISVSVGLVVSFLIWEFILPLVLKNGQTVGKKCFSVGVMQVTGVRINPLALLVRSLLGKCVIETMIPILLAVLTFSTGNLLFLIIVGAILILQICLLIFTKNNSLIHDAFSSTVVIDMQTQMIFDTKDEMINYKEEISRQETEKAEYK